MKKCAKLFLILKISFNILMELAITVLSSISKLASQQCDGFEIISKYLSLVVWPDGQIIFKDLDIFLFKKLSKLGSKLC